MSPDERRLHAGEVRDKIKRYEYVLKSFIAIEHEFCALGGLSVHQGKRLRVAGAEGGERVVTPDMAIEATGRGRPYRAVVEIKGSLSEQPENLGGVIAQLEKYRLATGGWGGAAPGAPHDVMLATDAPHAERLAKWVGDGRAGPGTEEWLVVIMVAAAKHGDEECMEIARMHGRIDHPKINERTSPEANCRIPMWKVMVKMDQLKFDDSHPPVEYTMTVLWDHVFSKFVHGKKLRTLRDGKDVPIRVSMGQITDRIKSFSPHTNQDCVHDSWIRDAMSMFKKMNVASGEVDGLFNITYRKHGMNTTEWIMRNTANPGRGGDGAQRARGARGTPPPGSAEQTRMTDYRGSI